MSYGQIWRPHRFTDDETMWDKVRERGRLNLLDQHAYIELLMSDGRDWALPAGYSIVDPYLLVSFRWGQRIGIDMRAAYPCWSASIDRVLARPAVQRALEQEGIEVS